MAATPPTSEAIASITTLYNDIQSKARPLVDRFESRYAAWRETWNTSSVRGDEFTRLVRMGIKILPLVVYKLCDENEAKAVMLYNAIEKDANFRSDSPSDIITKNYLRNQDYYKLSADWKAYKAQTFASCSQAYTMCCEYYDLLDLGPAIVPHAMLDYYDDMGGWWDELLCELISGHPSGAMVMFRDQIHRRWIDWFENFEGEHEAPYRLIGESARMERVLRAGGLGHPFAELDDGARTNL